MTKKKRMIHDMREITYKDVMDLQKRLDMAVEEENYEEAAKLRDMILGIKKLLVPTERKDLN